MSIYSRTIRLVYNIALLICIRLNRGFMVSSPHYIDYRVAVGGLGHKVGDRKIYCDLLQPRTTLLEASDVTGLVRLLVGWLEKLQKSQPVQSFDWLPAGWF